MRSSIHIVVYLATALLILSCSNHENQFRFHLENGIDLIFRARYQEAEAELKKALRHNPKSHEALYYLGACRRSLGDVSGAKAKFEESIKINPLYAEPYLGLALIYQEEYQDREMACFYFIKAEDLGINNLMDYTKRCR